MDDHPVKARSKLLVFTLRALLVVLSIEIPSRLAGEYLARTGFFYTPPESLRLADYLAYGREPDVGWLPRPEVDAVWGIPPTVAIEQRLSRGGRKSTVATTTEVWHFLRLLYVKLGTQHCIHDGAAVEPQSADSIAAQLLKNFRGQHIGLLAPLVSGRKGVYTELADWARPRGFTHLRVDGNFLPTTNFPRIDRFKEHNIELPVGMVKVGADTETLLREYVQAALDHGKGVLKVLPLGAPGAALITLSTLRACPDCGTSFPEPDPRLFSYNAKHGWCPDCYGTGLKIAGKVENPDDLDLGELDTEATETCPSCHGARLNPVARAVRFRDLGLHELASLPVGKVSGFFEGLKLERREAEIGRDLIAEIRGRLDFLQQVGLGYLALDRAAPTLSGGEAQRIRLAAQLGSNLTGVCYILDEPTIGLHPRDNRLLLDTLEALRARGNTLLVVEHDEDTIRRADHVIDIGPGAGVRGGRIVAEGLLADLMAAPESATGRCFAHPLIHPLAPRRAVSDDHPALAVAGATLHNLKNVTARVPLARLTVVTGVSGSGKSTFARDVLHASLVAAAPVGCASLAGAEQIGRVLEVDQTPIGKTPRSCPATYIGFWDTIRKLFAETNEAKLRGWTASRFSFNTGAGRCPVCEGQGRITIEMNFLPDVKMPCEACGGARFNPETLTVQWKGRSVAEVLHMAVEDAVDFFAAHPSIAHPLRLLQDVGLGYLTLGQPSPTLSGGEAQRIKLVSELAKVRGRAGESATGPGRPLPPEKHTLYVLDEPTVGLHMQDVHKLIRVLHRLVDGGHSVVVIEHDIEFVRQLRCRTMVLHQGEVIRQRLLDEHLIGGERPGAAPAAPVAADATGERTRRLPSLKADEAVARIKAGLRRRSGRAYKVSGGSRRSTAWGWIEIKPPGKKFGDGKRLTPAEAQDLARLLGLQVNEVFDGVTIPPDPEFYWEYVDRAEGSVPRVRGTRKYGD